MLNKQNSTLIVVIFSIFSLISCYTDNGTKTGDKKRVFTEIPLKWERDPVILKILECALNASSSHNAQPWKIQVHEEEYYTISSVRERWLPYVDPENRELMLSLGALIENISQSAMAFGYDSDFKILADDPEDLTIASFSLNKNAEDINRKKINIIKSVYTEKLKYKKGSLTPQTISSVFSLFEEKDLLSYYSHDSNEYMWLKDSSIKANRQQAWRDDVQMELADFICYSEIDEQLGIGLTPRMLRLPGFMIRSWYKRASEDSVMKKSFRNGAASKVRGQINNSSGLVLIRSNGTSVEDLLECGRLYQRFLIETRSQHIEVQPISQILEEDPWNGQIQEEMGFIKPVQFILRVGRLKGEKPDYALDSLTSASIRLPLNSVLEL